MKREKRQESKFQTIKAKRLVMPHGIFRWGSRKLRIKNVGCAVKLQALKITGRLVYCVFLLKGIFIAPESNI